MWSCSQTAALVTCSLIPRLHTKSGMQPHSHSHSPRQRGWGLWAPQVVTLISAGSGSYTRWTEPPVLVTADQGHGAHKNWSEDLIVYIQL